MVLCQLGGQKAEIALEIGIPTLLQVQNFRKMWHKWEGSKICANFGIEYAFQYQNGQFHGVLLTQIGELIMLEGESVPPNYRFHAKNRESTS